MCSSPGTNVTLRSGSDIQQSGAIHSGNQWWPAGRVRNQSLVTCEAALDGVCKYRVHCCSPRSLIQTETGSEFRNTHSGPLVFLSALKDKINVVLCPGLKHLTLTLTELQLRTHVLVFPVLVQRPQMKHKTDIVG